MAPRSVLVIVTRRIGDVLLATPVVRSLRRAWPGARIEALVFRGTEAVLAGNPDLDAVHTVAERPRFFEHARLHLALARRYDLALSLLTGDRPTLYAWSAGYSRAGPTMPEPSAWWKRRLLDIEVPFDSRHTHTVRMNLALAAALGVAPLAEVVVSWRAEDALELEALGLGGQREPYALLHPSAKFAYKLWRIEGWTEVGRWLLGLGLRLYISGSAEPSERARAAAIAERVGAGAHDLSGQLRLGALGCLLSRAALYVGPDTVVTHMAAALGVPTVAIFGPTDPVLWGPWPKGHPAERNPWRRLGTQRVGNVALVQPAAACVPCQLEGCARNVASLSDCLQELAARPVIAQAQALLADRAPA